MSFRQRESCFGRVLLDERVEASGSETVRPRTEAQASRQAGLGPNPCEDAMGSWDTSLDPLVRWKEFLPQQAAKS